MNGESGLKRQDLTEQEMQLLTMILWNSGNTDAMNLAAKIKKARRLIMETMN